ncbi:RNA 2',3'-cyclic phosphodiesterase [Deinococcus sp. SDU3-2]|uniref:RNA 2',3'-cyclic phosphodiesterase n=1 Tax=Deinococcus terrestris TaxID=2651870 RepID=A0A7X1NXA9_9DEIO|nr:RNA 2',3'-cyclic phosphodiesterase [Deinococcus terrestris]MPY67537.1 RNA 2',3'-cyclic phosphodiesterase [Deinococcus terrestris]
MKIRKTPRPAAPPAEDIKVKTETPRPDSKPRPAPSRTTGEHQASQTLRLFFAFKVPGDVSTPLAESQRHLRGNWRAVRADQLHITLAYLPAVPPDRVADLKRLGTRLTEHLPPMQVRLRGTGYFPNEGSPRVWFVKAEAEGLNELAAELRVGLKELGIATDDLPFKAHVTLARKKGPAPRVSPLLFDLGWQAGNMALIRSTLRKTGPIYDTVSTFRLRGAANGQPPAVSEEMTPSAPSPSQETP